MQKSKKVNILLIILLISMFIVIPILFISIQRDIEIKTTGSVNNVYVSGDYAYIAEGFSLMVIDVSDPTNPGTPVYEDTTGWARGVYVSGDYAYVADGDSGLAIIDISDPTNPGTPVYEDTTGYACGVYVRGVYAYVADYSSGLVIINISDSDNISNFILILIVFSIVVFWTLIITIKVRKRSKDKKKKREWKIQDEIAREKAEEQARVNYLKHVKAENQRIITQAKFMVETGQWSEAIKMFKKSKEISIKQSWSDWVKYNEEMISKCKEMKERQQQERERREKIERIMRVSSRIRLDTMRDILNLEPYIFHERLIDWAEKFGFEIDGDYLNINKDKVSDFIEKLDKQFSDWEQVEKDRIGKK